jgi:hypothetical protein
MSNLNSLLESSNQWKNVQSDAARLASKWNKTGLLEGLENEVERNNMSLILENQAKQLVVESSQTGGGTSSVGPSHQVLVVSGPVLHYLWYVRYLVKSLRKISFRFNQ